MNILKISIVASLVVLVSGFIESRVRQERPATVYEPRVADVNLPTDTPKMYPAPDINPPKKDMFMELGALEYDFDQQNEKKNTSAHNIVGGVMVQVIPTGECMFLPIGGGGFVLQCPFPLPTSTSPLITKK